MRASGVIPRSRRLRVAHHDDRGRAVVERARVPGGDLAVGTEHRLQLRELLDRRVGPRAVVLADHGAVGQLDGDDLALEEAPLLCLDGAVLRQRRELVHLLARDVLELGDVLGRLTHRDVDVGEAVGRRPTAPWPPSERFVLRRPRVLELRVLGVGPAVGRCPLPNRLTRLDAGGDERVALAGLDRVRGHADGLQRRRAVPVDRDAGDVLEAGEHAHDPAHVEALLAAREAAPEDEVLDLAPVELRHLVEHGLHDGAGEVVGSQSTSDPLYARPIGLRAVATITGSGISGLRGGSLGPSTLPDHE